MSSAVANQCLVVQLDGVFDLAAAQYVLERLARAPAASEVRVDLTHVREFHDHGVVALAEGLAKTQLRVSVRGLRTHHCRMLRYMGVSPGALDITPADRSRASTPDAG